MSGDNIHNSKRRAHLSDMDNLLHFRIRASRRCLQWRSIHVDSRVRSVRSLRHSRMLGGHAILGLSLELQSSLCVCGQDSLALKCSCIQQQIGRDSAFKNIAYAPHIGIETLNNRATCTGPGIGQCFALGILVGQLRAWRVIAILIRTSALEWVV